MFKKINPDSKLKIICFGGEDWWYHNRGHIDFQLMRRFAKIGSVLYINSVMMQKPKFSEGKNFLKKLVRKSKSILRGLQKTDAGFYAFSPLSLPLHHIGWAKRLNELIVRPQIGHVINKLNLKNPIVWVACPTAANLAMNIKKSMLVYQRTDKFEEFPNTEASIIRNYDLTLKRNADLTIFVNEKLYNDELSQCKKAVLIDHGVDFDRFAFAEKDDYIPEDIKDIPRPIVGFFGGIDNHTFDIDFVNELVGIMKNVSFVFVGNCSLDCSRLLSKPNVRMLGQKPYEQIPHYGKYFDVAIMPWKQNRWIENCNPIKLKEYLALGKPIVSTPFPQLKKYNGSIYISKNPVEFSKLTRKALLENNVEYIEARRAKVCDETWDNQADLILRMLYEKSGNSLLQNICA